MKTKVLAGSRDQIKHCDFHNYYSHNPDECISLRYEVLELLKRGHLVELFTERGRQNWKLANNGANTSAKPPERPPVNQTMNCIVGGSHVSEMSTSAAKRHCRSLKHSTLHPSIAKECEVAEINFSSNDARTLA